MPEPAQPTVTLSDALAEARRELALRQNVYPKWVQAGKLSPLLAQHRIACSELIVERLEMLVMLAESTEPRLFTPSNPTSPST